jgi:plastocyanin
VPFAVNASVGDTVKFIWGANEHTVTKSSQLAICNKTSDQPFASGEQNQTFVCKNETFALMKKIDRLSFLSHSDG